MVKTVAVVGASGYTGIEALKILARHPGVKLLAASAQTYAGKPLASLMGAGAPEMNFCPPDAPEIAQAEVVFSCLPHGAGAENIVQWRQQGRVVFDLSADFRLKDPALYDKWYGHTHAAPDLLKTAVYGLPEARRDAIKNANLIACPGCYPTATLLGLLPVARAGWVKPAVFVSAVSGASGAGRKSDAAYAFCEVNENLYAYAAPKHRHTPEMEQELSLAAGKEIHVSFVPHLGPFNRGIHATIFAEPAIPLSAAELVKYYEDFYFAAPFVKVTAENPQLKDVRGTNHCHIRPLLDERTGKLIVLSAIDNLIKGAAGQAVQCFNIRFGFAETDGLLMPPV
ncbi:MAG: N-acetyl-gamma-glutamyl-phosphate reductase [Nitrospinae bacterium]|nr:N-acetyl-gamma-glutamyl-phosphate reductase [Nitrospinota bacterium]